MKKLTIFTTTFNRVHLLPRLYESLCVQTSQDFLWLVIDDGSTDHSDKLIKIWQDENLIEIKYFFKENGGMHTGHNAAYKLIDTELNICIDSDDYMPSMGVEIILKSWAQIPSKNRICGMVGLDFNVDNEVIGDRMPIGVKEGSHIDLYKKYKIRGDKKFVLKTEDVKKYPSYPEYKNEKLVPLGILYMIMGEDKPFVYVDEIFCIVDYQKGGSSNTIFKQYFQSPRGFIYARKIRLKYETSVIDILKNCLHLSSLIFITKDFKLVWHENNFKFLTCLLTPFGFFLFKYLQLKK